MVSVGPNADEEHKIANLTLDGAINCGCDVPGIEQGSGDSLNRFFAIMILILTLIIGIRAWLGDEKKVLPPSLLSRFTLIKD